MADKGEELERYEEFEPFPEIEGEASPPFKVPLKTKVLIWSIVGGSIAVGTLLFLFFLTAFVYFFLPLMAVFFLWGLIRRFLRR